MHALAIVAAQYTGVLDLADTSTLTLRAPSQIVSQSGEQKKVVIAADLGNAPLARLGLQGRRWNFTLSYSPSLTLPDVELGFPATTPPHQPLFLQAAISSFAWRGRFLQMSVTESASYGNTYYYQVLSAATQAASTAPSTGQTTTGGQAGMPNPTGTPGQTGMPSPMGTPGLTGMPGQTGTASQTGQTTAPGNTVFIASSITNATLAARVGHDTTLSLLGGYTLSGGATTSAQQLLPEQYGPSAGVSIAYAPSVRDTMTTLATAQELLTTGPCAALQPAQLVPPPGVCHERTPIAQALETLRHQISPVATLTLRVGAAITNAQTTTTAQESGILPVALGSLAYRLGAGHVSILTLSVGLTPIVDIRTGLPSDEVQTILSLSQPVSRTTTLLVSAGELQSIPYWVPPGYGPESGWIDPYALSALTGGVDVKMRIDHRRTLTFGTQGLWQHQSSFGTLGSLTEYATLILGPQLTLMFGVQAFWQDLPGGGTVSGLPVSTYASIILRSLPLRF